MFILIKKCSDKIESYHPTRQEKRSEWHLTLQILLLTNIIWNVTGKWKLSVILNKGIAGIAVWIFVRSFLTGSKQITRVSFKEISWVGSGKLENTSFGANSLKRFSEVPQKGDRQQAWIKSFIRYRILSTFPCYSPVFGRMRIRCAHVSIFRPAIILLLELQSAVLEEYIKPAQGQLQTFPFPVKDTLVIGSARITTGQIEITAWRTPVWTDKYTSAFTALHSIAQIRHR